MRVTRAAPVLAVAAALCGCHLFSAPAPSDRAAASPNMPAAPPAVAEGPPTSLTSRNTAGSGAGAGGGAPLDIERTASVGEEVASSDGTVLYYEGALADGTLRFREAVSPREFKDVTFNPRASTYYPFGRFDIEIYSSTPAALDYTIRPAD